MLYQQDDTYVYGLSEKVFESMELLFFDSSTSETIEIKESQGQDSEVVKTENKTSKDRSAECNTCNIKLDDRESLKAHYKTDYHRLNIKRSVNNLPPLTEDEYEKLVEEESIDSLSGSDSDSETNETDTESKLETIFEKFSINPDDNSEEKSICYLNTKSPFILFKSDLLDNDTAFGVYKSLYREDELLNDPKISLKEWSSPNIKKGKSALFMVGGGHFAGAIISHMPKSIKGNVNHKESKQQQAVDILMSKTFHRYTTRRKQGGSQSASDNARGKANSAGSSIRRYNEQALIKEIRELLVSWKKELDECHSIFIRANGATNRKILVGYEGSVLNNDDKRIRSFPFTTKRATTSELKRAWVQLSYLQLVKIPKAKTSKKTIEQKSTQSIPSRPIEEISDEEKHTLELISIMKKQRAPLLLSYLKKNQILANFKLCPHEKYLNYPTLLHYASFHDLSHIVQVLLVNLKADASVKNEYGKTPYEITNQPSTKKVFRIARHKLGEDYMNWSITGIDSAKSKEEFEIEEQAELERIKNEKRSLIEQQLQNKTELELKQPKYSSGGKLGGVNVALNEMNELSESQRIRLMREQRARAAEARMKQSQ